MDVKTVPSCLHGHGVAPCEVETFCRRLDGVSPKLAQSLEEFCACIGEREYVKANKAGLLGAGHWEGEHQWMSV